MLAYPSFYFGISRNNRIPTESDAWILVSELPETFRHTLMQETPTFASMPADEAAELIRELERLLVEE